MQQTFNRITQNIFKFLYKSFHSKAYKHNRRYWPYYKTVRNSEGDLEQLFFNKKLIELKIISNKAAKQRNLGQNLLYLWV